MADGGFEGEGLRGEDAAGGVDAAAAMILVVALRGSDARGAQAARAGGNDRWESEGAPFGRNRLSLDEVGGDEGLREDDIGQVGGIGLWRAAAIPDDGDDGDDGNDAGGCDERDGAGRRWGGSLGGGFFVDGGHDFAGEAGTGADGAIVAAGFQVLAGVDEHAVFISVGERGCFELIDGFVPLRGTGAGAQGFGEELEELVGVELGFGHFHEEGSGFGVQGSGIRFLVGFGLGFEVGVNFFGADHTGEAFEAVEHAGAEGDGFGAGDFFHFGVREVLEDAQNDDLLLVVG